MPSTNQRLRTLAVATMALLLGLFLASPLAAQNVFQTHFSRFQATIANQPQEAEKAARAYLAAAQQRGDAKLTMLGYWLAGRALAAQDQQPEAEQNFAASLAASQKVPVDQNFKVLVARILFDRADNFSSLGQHERAIDTLDDVIARLEQLPNVENSAMWRALYVKSGAEVTLGRLKQAEATLDRLDKLIARESPEVVQKRSYYLSSISRLRVNQHRYEEAEQFCRQELALTIKSFGADSKYTGHSWHSLGILLMRQQKYFEAEQAYQQAVQILRSSVGEQSLLMANVHRSLGSLFHLQGRYAEGESHLRQSLATQRKILGVNHPSTLEQGAFLGSLYLWQRRYQEALPFYEAATQSYRKTRGPNHPLTRAALGSYCDCLVGLGHWQQAEATLLDALKLHGPDSQESLGFVQVLIKLYEKQQRYKDAEKLILQSIAIQTERGNVERGRQFLAFEYDALGLIYYGMERYADGRAQITKAIEIFEAEVASADSLALSYAKRARGSWELDDLDAAQADLEKAMDLADTRRVQLSGAAQDRSESFSELAIIYEYAVRLQTRRGDLAAALVAMERGRARSLLEQINLQGIDLLAGVEPNLAQNLRDRKVQTLRDVSAVESELEQVSDDESLDRTARQARRSKLLARLRSAQASYAAVEADIRNASPAYRLAVGRDFRPVTLGELQTYVDEQQAMLLRYVVGGTGTYLLALAANEAPRLIALQVSQDQAKSVGVPAGPLTLDSLNQLLTNSQQTGALQLLRAARTRPGEAAAAQAMQRLWQTLIPEPIRQRLIENKVQRLVVIPDGALAMLPFEALVVEAAGDPKYLLDVGPPIIYAPSASLLYNLANSPAKEIDAKVLSVGDPAYGSEPEADEAVASGRSRYRAAGGKLARLPYSGLEASWVEQIFDKSDIPVQRLVGTAATERAIRAGLAGKSLVHLACHGITDQSLGNLFGALAFAPGSAAGSDSTDDGVLSLAEIYELNLSGCELAILSACDTNIGPAQQGEGVWALSRGFLVAGSKRVVASNWVVDDKAAASLISYYCGFLARAKAEGKTPDYATSLRDARRWVRDQPAWSSPYYWATFVHMGPP